MAGFDDQEITDILEYLQSLKSICSEAERYWYGLEIDRVEYIHRKLPDHLSILERVVACCERAIPEVRELTRAIRELYASVHHMLVHYTTFLDQRDQLDIGEEDITPAVLRTGEQGRPRYVYLHLFYFKFLNFKHCFVNLYFLPNGCQLLFYFTSILSKKCKILETI